MSIKHESEPRRKEPIRASLFALCSVCVVVWMLRGPGGCSIADMFAVPCPSCGTTRSVRALLDGDVALAFTHNPAGLMVALCLAFVLACAVVRLWREGSLSRLGRGMIDGVAVRVLVAAFALEIIVWAVRFLGFFGGPVAV